MSKKMPKVSIAIPTWESHGRGQEFLDDLLGTIQIQTLKDIEVIVSDHSVDNDVKVVVNSYAESGLNIKHFRNTENRGNGPANTNTAIDLCTGEIVKVMFQDDFFYDDEALEKIYDALTQSDKEWLVCGCNHTNDDGESFYWTLMPEWNDNILQGVNTISSPSVMAFKRERVDQRFDESLTMMMDCEMYYRMKKNYGDPVYLHDDLVTNRMHDKQISSMYTDDTQYLYKIKKEIEYCENKEKNS